MTGFAPVIFISCDSRRKTLIPNGQEGIKMKSILEQFYYGNITPCETPTPETGFKRSSRISTVLKPRCLKSIPN